MSSNGARDVTRMLQDWDHGDPHALENLLPVVYAEIHRLARRYVNRGVRHSLQATELIDEAFVRLVDLRGMGWRDRGHFYAIVARTMRNIIVDRARKSLAEKRGGGRENLVFDEGLDVDSSREARQLVALDDALSTLFEVEPELGRFVELRYFMGLSVEETAEVLGVSNATVKRGWSTAKSWLRRELLAESADE